MPDSIMPRLGPDNTPTRNTSTTPRANQFTSPIPQPAQNGDNFLATLVALKNSVESLAGQRGPADTRAVTFRDLLDYGLLLPSALRSPRGLASGGPVGSTGPAGPPGPPGPVDLELIDDRVAALLVAGANITLSYDDLGNSLTIASTGGAVGSALVTISDTAPVAPTPGTLWWDSVSGQLFIWYSDPNSSAWIIANTGGAEGGAIGDLFIDCGAW